MKSWTAIAGFAVLLGVAIAADFLYFAVLPLAVAAIALALVRKDILLMAIVAMVPLSMSLEELGIRGVGPFGQGAHAARSAVPPRFSNYCRHVWLASGDDIDELGPHGFL